MDFIDYYKLLEVAKTATEAEIKKSFRRLARKYHPDLHPDDKDAKRKFQQINEAYEVLSDPEKRAQYDKYGEDWKHGEAYENARKEQEAQYSYSGTRAGSDFEGFSGGMKDSDAAGFSDFFESLFGYRSSGSRQSARSQPFKGQDIHAELTLSLQEAAHTHQQILQVNSKKVRITIPAGLENGQKIKLKDYGMPGIDGGSPGNLIVTFLIAADSRYQRKGDDIYISEQLPLYTAILGGEKEVETLNGRVKVQVRALTQNESKVRLKGKGFPVYKKEGMFGDLYIKWVVVLPQELSERDRSLFQQLAANH